MKIGFIGFGQVNQTLSEKLKNTHQLYTSIENRSNTTINTIKKAKINYFKTDIELAKNVELLISANTPKSALPTAKKYSKIYNGLYLDLNNINPITTEKINNLFSEKFIDGAIIGNIKKLQLLLISGQETEKLKFLNNIIETKIISKKPGDASKLKILRSTYTKGVSALLKETFDIAKTQNIDKQLWEILEKTENNTNFKENSTSRIKNTEKNNKRKIEEIEEILEFLEYINTSDYNKIMIKSTYSKLKNL